MPKRVLSWWWSMLRMWMPSRCRKSTGIRSMLPQSRKTATRSSMSAGGAPTIVAVLHVAVLVRQRELVGRQVHQGVLAELRQHAVHPEQRAERVAVGVLVRRQQELVGAAQLLDDVVELGSHAAHDSRALLVDLVEQLRDPHSALERLVVLEGERRRVLDPQLARDPRLEEAARGLESRHRLCPLLLVAEHAHVDAGVAKVWARVDGCHSDESNAGVFESPSDSGGKDLPQGLVHAPHAIRGHPIGPNAYWRVFSTCRVS